MKNEFLICKRYVKEVSAVIICSKREKLFFMRELKDSVSSYVEDHPDCTLETLYAEFGSPEQFANDLMTRDDYAKMFKKAKTKAIVWKCVALIAVVIAAWICFGVINWLLSRNSTFTVDPPEVSYHIEGSSQQ